MVPGGAAEGRSRVELDRAAREGLSDWFDLKWEPAAPQDSTLGRSEQGAMNFGMPAGDGRQLSKLKREEDEEVSVDSSSAAEADIELQEAGVNVALSSAGEQELAAPAAALEEEIKPTAPTGIRINAQEEEVDEADLMAAGPGLNLRIGLESIGNVVNTLAKQ